MMEKEAEEAHILYQNAPLQERIESEKIMKELYVDHQLRNQRSMSDQTELIHPRSGENSSHLASTMKLEQSLEQSPTKIQMVTAA